MSKGGNTQQTQQQSTVSLPGWVDQAATDNYAKAQQVSNNLMGPYTGQRVATMTPEQQQLIQQLYGNVGSTTGAFNAAQQATQGLMGYTPQQVNAQQLANTNLQPYMNPYTQSVINPALQQMNVANQQALNQIGSSASRVGAFGGSRQGVQEGSQQAMNAMNQASLVGNLQNQNFQQAQAAATGDIQRQMAAQQLNQAAGEWGAGFQGNMAGQLGNLAQQGQQNWLAGVSAAMGGQQQLTAQQQAQLNAQMQQYQEQQQFPIQQLQILQNALAVSPYGQTTNTYGTQTGGSGSGVMQGLGGLMSLGGIFGQLATPGAGGVSALGNLFGAGAGAGGAAASAAPALLDTIAMASDRRLKTDISKFGADGLTGLPLYAYRYKGDPKSYPKVVGPMAQDIKKKFPEQVVEVGGRLAVKPNFLAGVMARAA